MQGRLIVLSGEAGAGKDSVAQLLIERLRWTSYSLAAPLKRFVQDMFSFTDAQVYGPSSARNAPDPPRRAYVPNVRAQVC
jgi:deoxynucleotide monophosphate kinase-like protein